MKCLVLCLQLQLVIVSHMMKQHCIADGSRSADHKVDFTNDMCYHSTGRSQFCQPKFTNLAKTRQLHASSTCGNPPVRVCRRIKDAPACEVCDASQPSRSHPASYLTDYQVQDTCWISEPLTRSRNSVNLTLSLQKKYIVYYVSLSGCGAELPDSVEVYKSFDYGSSWQQWHLFSKNCERDYGKRGMQYQFIENIQPKEVVCSVLNQFSSITSSGHNQRALLTFSTSYNRINSNDNYGADPILLNWMLVTDIRFVLKRRPRPDGSISSEPFAFSDVDVGGRCFCNGHASSCRFNKDREICDCRHGTEGDDCERCRSFFVDLPWRRATVEHPFSCKRCECNSHSSNCIFSVKAYKENRQAGGGVCVNCSHHTQGRHCHECRPKFHRNENVNMHSTHACTTCNCHPLGSRTNVCDKDTGKCVCKEGVKGKKCDRCIDGYVQTSDHRQPCRKAVTTTARPVLAEYPPIAAAVPDRNRDATMAHASYWPPPIIHHKPNSASTARINDKDSGSTRRNNRRHKKRRRCPKKCKSGTRKVDQIMFCIQHWIGIIKVRKITKHKRWISVNLNLIRILKCSGPSCNISSSSSSSSSSATLWIRRRHWRCRCPRLRAGRRYLILTKNKLRDASHQLQLTHRSIVIRWQHHMLPQLLSLQNFAAVGGRFNGCHGCSCLERQHRRRRRERRRRRRRRQMMRERQQQQQQQQQQHRKRAASGSTESQNSQLNSFLFGGSQ